MTFYNFHCTVLILVVPVAANLRNKIYQVRRLQCDYKATEKKVEATEMLYTKKVVRNEPAKPNFMEWITTLFHCDQKQLCLLCPSMVLEFFI